MLTGRQIMKSAGTLLLDEEHVRWPLAELANWINEGVDAVLLAKPSAYSASIVMPLQRGTLQQVPQTGSPQPLRIMNVTRNIVSDGPPRIAGRAVRPTIRALLDTQEPNWHVDSAMPFKREVRQFVFDEENPLEFYVCPGNNGQGRLEVVVSARPARLVPSGPPAEMASYEGEVGLHEIYSGPLVDYVCYRAQLKDDIASNTGRAAVHYQNFATALGVKIQVEGTSSPNRERRR